MPTLEKSAKAKVVSMPQTNGFTHITMNTQMAPFDNVKVRQAVAAALPYDDMFKAAIFDRGASSMARLVDDAAELSFPQPIPNKTDLALAKKLLAEAGLPNGFSTTFALMSARRRPPSRGGAAEGIAGQDRHPGRDPEEARRRVQHDGSEQQDAVLRRRRHGLAALHLLLLLPLLHAPAALELRLLQERKMEETLKARYQTDKAKYDDDCEKMIESSPPRRR